MTEKKCDNCKFLKWKANEEPCFSCDGFYHNNWEPKMVNKK